MNSRLRLSLLLFSGALAACDGGPVGVDGGPPPEEDAGSRRDADVVADGGPGDAGMDADVEPSCMDECAAGSQACDGANQYRVCGQYDLDECLEPSPAIFCAEGYACQGDACVPPCRDECPVGGSICMDESSVLLCGNYDADACREPGGAVSCGTGERCEQGSCVPATAPCTDECSAAGATVCFGDAVRSCGSFDSDGCLDLGAPIACESGQVCDAGACTAYCTDECPAEGAVECAGNAVRTCGRSGAGACLEWSAPVACEGGEFCTAGACSTTCTDECSNPGGPVCAAGGLGVAICGEFDGDPCTDVSSSIACRLGFTCQSGLCSPSCTNECTLADGPRCTGSGVQTCGNYDADVCYEWGGDAACPGGATCTDGACDTPCTDECTTAGAIECASGMNATRECGQFDLDSCREWSAPSACAAWEACAAGSCDLGPTPADVVINEVSYDAVGADSAAGNTIFVELWGDPGASLEGWALVGVDGNTGADYNAIALDGQAIGPDGWFVIAHPSAAATILAAADLTSAQVDLQNGPDSVQLRWRGRVVDALGYGTFGAGTTFAGEGTAAAGVAAGRSLTRDASHADTGNNAADFASATPTPRADDVGCTDECTGSATRCSGTQVQTCGNHDADACREWSAPAACPTAGHVCSGSGVCGPAACTDECPAAGARQCSGIQVQTCVTNYDADPCLEWNAPAGCPNAGEQCSGAGVCSIPCTDECTAGTSQCSGTQRQTCGNFDADGCNEWSAAADCPGAGEQCQGAGVCSIPCTDECAAMGVTRCLGTQVQTCGNHDADSCREWSTAASCPAGELCSGTACRDASAPEVVLISPMGTIQTTQGNMHRMIVDATPAAGRTITSVQYFANGMMIGTTSAAPHELVYTVPASAVTGSSIALHATAVDNASSVGTSQTAILNVRNDAPVASFTATITNASVATVDASATSDTETPTPMLEVRWDWTNDGTWDTPFSTTKIVTHDFGASGTFTIGMQVRDAVGQLSTTTRTVTFADIMYLGGMTVTTTTWYGTIVVTGDLTVGAGQTLTIASGTDILFVRSDVDPPAGVGDYALFVDGTLVVNGTAEDPVVFSGQDAAGHTPGAWDRIRISGSTPSTISHAIIEYADVGLEIRNASTLNNVVVRNTRSECVLLNNADGASLTDSTTTLCGGNGVTVNGGSVGVMMTRHTSTSNGADGISVSASSSVSATGGTFSSNAGNGATTGTGSTFGLEDATVASNAGRGLLYQSSAGGTVRHNQIRMNGAEGVGLRSDSAGDPNPVINDNNIYSNATTGSTSTSTVATSGTLAASQTCCSTSTSSIYTAPAGQTIYRVFISYNEAVTSSYVSGTLRDAATGATIRSFTSDFSGWVLVPAGTTRVHVSVTDSGYSSATDTITGTQVELLGSAGASDVHAQTVGGTPDLRYNYLGTFPNVLSRVTMNRNDALNLQGFVGVLYGDTWSRGPYLAGPLTTQTWPSTVYVTGDITIAAGQTITVPAGAQVLFVDHDQDANMRGDFSITANGQLNLAGTAGAPVLVSAYGAPMDNAFQSVVLAGSTTNASTWTHVNVDHGFDGVTVQGGSSLADVVITGGGGDGLTVRGAGATFTDVHVTGALDDGVVLDNGDNVTFTRLTTEMNGGDGFQAAAGSTGLTVSRSMSRMNGQSGFHIAGGSAGSITDTTSRENGVHGVYIVDSSPTVDYNLITYNGGAGLWIAGTSTTSAQYNVIKFNDDAGYSVWSTASGSPTPTLQHSNVYSNAVQGTTRTTTVSTSGTLSASQTCCSTSTSSTYTAPAGQLIWRVNIAYNEAVTSSYVSGALIDADTGATLRSFTSDFNGWVLVPAGTRRVYVRVTDSGYSSATDTITGTQVELTSFTTADHYELAAHTESGTTLARFNYWTPSIVDVPTKILQWRAMSVDYMGFTGLEYPSGTVMQVGPRP